MTDWRLGLDLGTASLGWAALRLNENGDPDSILAAGSRIFGSDVKGAGRNSQSGESLAVARRDARAMRRGRDRFQQRQRALMTHLVADGLFPADPAERRALETLDPYELRARALDEALTLPELGRAIWHLNQRRGFKSNRKTDKADKPGDESGKIKVGVGRLQTKMDEAGARTFGEFLHLMRLPGLTQPNDNPKKTYNHSNIASVRTRLRVEPGEDAKGNGYDFYPGRELLEEEFDAIWAEQASHHPELLTPAIHDRLREIVFHQRPLKQPKVGTDTFGNGEPRLAKAHPLFQRRRLLEEVNALMIVRVGQNPERLTPEQRDLLLLKLKGKGKVSFETLRKVLKLEPEARFNKESQNRTDLKGDEVVAAMVSKSRLGDRWYHLTDEEQRDIVERLEASQSDADVAAFQAWATERFNLSSEQAAGITSARLPQGYGRFGETVTRGLIDALTLERTPAGRLPSASPTESGRVIVYSEAVNVLGLHHSDLRSDKKADELLPYPEILERHLLPGSGKTSDTDVFERVGRLTNPTVHIGLNQLRRTVNKLIERYGPPAEIAIELARELKLTDEEKKKRGRENNENRLAAERRGRILEENGIENTGENRAKLRLWEELDSQNAMGRQCVYSGEVIGIRRLFSPEVEIDHILPFRDTLDDSNGNKIVCVQKANRFKRKRSPFGAWGGTPDWEEIAERASRLPRGKRWRFEPDAMERFKVEAGFLPRQLVDTQYLARLAREYMASLYPDKGEGSSNVWVSPGKMTAMVRRKLGLDRGILDNDNLTGSDRDKNRLDHRHHAVDAITIAIVDRSLLQRMSHAAGLEGAEGSERIHVPEPWEGFRDEVRIVVRAITTSHRPDHGTAGHGAGSTAGRLHNDTAYGFTGRTDAKGLPIVVRRKPLGSLKPGDVAGVRDPDLRIALHAATDGLDGKALERALADFPRLGPLQFRGVRRVRVTEPLSVIPIRNRAGKAYKGYKGDSNYRYDIWEMPDGKWRSQVVSMFDAHQPGEQHRPHPAAKRVMSLFRDDMLAIERAGDDRELVRIVKFSDNQFAVAPPNEAGALKARDADKGDPFKYIYPSPNTLKSWRARKVDVDEIGRVRDPGFPMRTAVRRTRPKPAG